MPRVKVRKVRGSTRAGEIPKDSPRQQVLTLRTEYGLNRATTFIEREQRKALIRSVKALKPIFKEWAQYVKRTQGKDSADYKRIEVYWQTLVCRYKQAKETERYYQGEKPEFDPDYRGERW